MAFYQPNLALLAHANTLRTLEKTFMGANVKLILTVEQDDKAGKYWIYVFDYKWWPPDWLTEWHLMVT